jgi:spermidine/putrescine transport system permease protein
MNHSRWFRNITVGTAALWLVVLVLVPTLMVAVMSLMTYSETELFDVVFTLHNYRELFDTVFFRVLVSSFRLAFFTTLITLITAYPFAYNLARYKGRYKPLLMVLIIIPFWTSSLIRTYAMVMILKTNGLLNSALMWAGLISEPLKLMYTETAVLIGMVYSLLPFMILPLYAVLEKFDYRLIEAAKDLGAGRFGTFRYVVLPLTMPGIIAGCMLVFLPSLSLFYISDLLGGAKTLLVGNFIKNQFLFTRNWPLGSAASMMLTFVMFALMFAYYKSSKRAGRGSAI